MTADDLSDLFADPSPGPSLDMRYRQGTVVTFDTVTLENQVDVGGATFFNLPVFSSGAAITLAPGQVVGIVSVVSSKGTASWAILGQLLIPTP